MTRKMANLSTPSLQLSVLALQCPTNRGPSLDLANENTNIGYDGGQGRDPENRTRPCFMARSRLCLFCPDSTSQISAVGYRLHQLESA